MSDTGGYTLAGTYNQSAHDDSQFRGGWRPAQLDPEHGRLARTTSGELDQSRVLAFPFAKTPAPVLVMEPVKLNAPPVELWMSITRWPAVLWFIVPA